MNNKKIVCKILILLIMTSVIFAQEGAAGNQANIEEQIDLPEVTTIISTEDVVANVDSLPDFVDVMIAPQKSSDLVPVLPDMNVEENDREFNLEGSNEQKSIYAEGQLGGGYPSLFLGDFSVYRLNGTSPFKVEFNHNAGSGYANHGLTDGYNHSNTSIYVEQSFAGKIFDFNYGANYKTLSNGLQNKVQNISDIKQNYIGGFLNFDWSLPKHFGAGATVHTDFYTRYLDISTSEATLNIPKNVKSASFYNFAPSIYGKWANNGFETSLTLNYLFDGSSRGQFDYYFGWQNDFIKTYGKVGEVVGQKLNTNKVLVPFTVGIDSSFPVYFSNRNLSLEVMGGLESYKDSVATYENAYRFTNFIQDNSEVSNWFATFKISVPVQQLLTCKAEINFKKSAFDDGIWSPDYNNASFGLYDFSKQNQTVLTTNMQLVYRFKLVNFELGWKSNWLDIPVLESSQLITFNCGFQNENGFIGTNLISGFYFGDGVDYPLISANFFIKLSTATKFVISADDILKLVTRKERIYGGQYISTGGNVSAMVKFFF